MRVLPTPRMPAELAPSLPCPPRPRPQWDIVKSVVKSVAGLQGRKFKVGWADSGGVVGRLSAAACCLTAHVAHRSLLTPLAAPLSLRPPARPQELLPEGFPGEEGEGGGRRKPGLLAQVRGGGGWQAGWRRAERSRKVNTLAGWQARRQSSWCSPCPASCRPLPATHHRLAATQLQALGKGRREPGAAGGEDAPSGEELRAEHKRRMLFGQAHLARASQSAAAAATATSLRAATAAAAPGSGSPRSVPPSPAAAMGRAAGASEGATPHGRGSSEEAAEVAGSGQVFPSLQGATSALSGASRHASGGQEGEEDGGDAAAAALLGRQPDGGGGGGGSTARGLPTPRWAKQLASGAKKGLTKLRDSLQDQPH